MAKYIDIVDTTYASSYKASFGTAFVDKEFLKMANYAKRVGISSFEVAGFNGFEDIAKAQKSLAFNYLHDFRELVSEDSNLSTTVNTSTLISNEVVSKEFVKEHAKLMKKYNINTIRVFDNLNNVKNIGEVSAIYKKEGLSVETIIVLAQRYSVEYYGKLFDEFVDSSVELDTLFFVDNFGACAPTFVADVISLAKMFLGDYLFIGLKSNDSMYLGTSTYLAALDAGVDILDVAIYPFSGCFGSPDLLSLLYATKKLDYNIGDLDIDNITMYQKELAAKVYSKSAGIKREQKSNVYVTPFPAIELNEYNKSIDRGVIRGSINDEISYILNLLKVKNISQPFSRFIYAQALLNIKNGRWEAIDKNFASILAVSSIKLEPKLAKKINIVATQKKFKPNIDEYLFKLGVENNPENRFIFSLYDLEEKESSYSEELITKKRILGEKEEYCVEVGQKKFLVKIRDVQEEIEVINYNSDANTEKIVSEYSGTVMSIHVAIGSSIIEGQLLMVIWSSGKEYEVASKIEGIVYNVYVKEGQEVLKGQNLLSVEVAL